MGVRELAEKADMSTNTVLRAERGDSVNTRSLQKIREVFEAAGVQFPDLETVRLPPRKTPDTPDRPTDDSEG